MDANSVWDGVSISGLVAPAIAGKLMGTDRGQLAHAIGARRRARANAGRRARRRHIRRQIDRQCADRAERHAGGAACRAGRHRPARPVRSRARPQAGVCPRRAPVTSSARRCRRKASSCAPGSKPIRALPAARALLQPHCAPPPCLRRHRTAGHDQRRARRSADRTPPAFRPRPGRAALARGSRPQPAVPVAVALIDGTFGLAPIRRRTVDRCESARPDGAPDHVDRRRFDPTRRRGLSVRHRRHGP